MFIVCVHAALPEASSPFGTKPRNIRKYPAKLFVAFFLALPLLVAADTVEAVRGSPSSLGGILSAAPAIIAFASTSLVIPAGTATVLVIAVITTYVKVDARGASMVVLSAVAGPVLTDVDFRPILTTTLVKQSCFHSLPVHSLVADASRVGTWSGVG